ncbi:MAG: apolipoprotein N-acyltransferase [Pseudomonadota bacterium]
MAILERLSQSILLLEGWRAALLAVVMGALTALALAPVHATPIIFITLPVMVWLMDGAAPLSGGGLLSPLKKAWPAFKLGWLFGFGYCIAGFWWVGQAFLVEAEVFAWLMPFAVMLLPAGLALFYGIAFVLARMAWTDNRPSVGWVRLVALAAALAFMEWVRGTALTGLPWNTLGYTIMPTPIFMQASSLIGLYGMTFLAVLVGAMLLVALAENRWLLIVPLVLLIAQPLYGFIRLAHAPTDTVPGVKLRIVQPALDQREKWDPEKTAEIMQRYLDLSDQNKGPEAAGAGSFTHIVWPESAFPFILTRRPDELAAMAAMLPDDTTLLTGAMRLEEGATGRRVYNSLYAINGQGQIIEARDKTRLLPFGEFLPFQNFLEAMGLRQLTQQQGGFAQGIQRRTVSMNGAPPFLPLICYEIIFSGRVAGSGPKPGWIVNVTNDAWFGMTSGPHQHAHQAQVRAVEEGLPVVRAANNGISMVVDAHGRITQSLGLGKRGTVDAPLPTAIAQPPFARTGNLYVILFICVLLTCLIGVAAKNTHRL